MLPPEALRENLGLTSSDFWGLLKCLGLWLHHSVSASGVTLPLLYVCHISASLRRIHVFAFGTHLDHPGYSLHLQILYLIIFAKALFYCMR